MENNGKLTKRKFFLFRKSTAPHHFESAKSTIITDPNGSYTGTPVNEKGTVLPDEIPTQDADDL